MNNKDELPQERINEFFQILKARFGKNMSRHKGIKWPDVQAKLESKPEKLWSLNEMEETGGEPDVIDYDEKSGEYIFYDCAPETPKGRRSICYDPKALAARKENKPKNSAIGMAAEMGIEILTEEQYRNLHKMGTFDSKTSSWIVTPEEMRELGVSIFADYRFGRVFVYHNGVESYYGGRGFRGMLRV